VTSISTLLHPGRVAAKLFYSAEIFLKKQGRPCSSIYLIFNLLNRGRVPECHLWRCWNLLEGI